MQVLPPTLGRSVNYIHYVQSVSMKRVLWKTWLPIRAHILAMTTASCRQQTGTTEALRYRVRVQEINLKKQKRRNADPGPTHGLKRSMRQPRENHNFIELSVSFWPAFLHFSPGRKALHVHQAVHPPVQAIEWKSAPANTAGGEGVFLFGGSLCTNNCTRA